WFALNDIDLNGVASADLALGWIGEPSVGFEFEAHLDSPDGKLIGKGGIPTPSPKEGKQGLARATISIPLSPITDGNLHQIYFTYRSQDTKATSKVNVVLTS